MRLFNEQINNWQDWGKVFQSIAAFMPLVENILEKEGLPLDKIENLTPGTNAVFKVGNHVIKLFAPSESGMDQTLDLRTELFALQRANEIGLSAPKLIAEGFIEDRYHFAYMITEYIDSIEFTEKVKTMTNADKTAIGRKLRIITDSMNTPCDPFNVIDVINDKIRSQRWDKYPEQFKTERLAYIQSHDYGENVFVHGDLCGDNILITPQGELFIIDFADAVLAPKHYEHALVAVELFDLDHALLQGFFGNYSAVELTEICFDGLLIHDFGGDVVEQHLGKPSDFNSLSDLKNKISSRLNTNPHNAK